MSPIEAANEAKKVLLRDYKSEIEDCWICLGDKGFRVELRLKPKTSSNPPEFIHGIAVLVVADED